MESYQITATVEKIDFSNAEIKLQLKGVNKWFFETDSKGYNILEHDDTIKSKFSDSSNDYFCIDIKDKDIASNLLSHAFIEKKRLKFKIDEDNGKYTITAISKAD